jgi:hypothetical protein
VLEAEQLVQDPCEAAAAAVQGVGESAEQVAEQLSWPGLPGDLEVHLVQVHDQPEQIEVQRPER